MKLLPMIFVTVTVAACGNQNSTTGSSVNAVASARGPRPTVSSVTALANAAKDASERLENVDGCSLAVARTASGITLRLDEGNGHIVEVAVASTDVVKVADGGEGDVIYTVNGKSSLELVDADDAFYAATLKSGADSAQCEVDF